MQAQPCLAFGLFRLDLRDQRLWRRREVVCLYPKPFAVLCCLVTPAGQLVTKDTLRAAVWPETLVSASVLTVAIRQLRQALDDRAQTPQFVEIVHGRGYCFIAPVAVAAPAPESPPIVDKKHLAERLTAFVAEWKAHAHALQWPTKSVAKVLAKCENPVAKAA